jgi:hypothetical protein
MTVKMTRRAERAEKRRRQWNRAEQPYFHECLTCELDCGVLRSCADRRYEIWNCPKNHDGEPFFPYKYEEEKEKHERRGR